MSAQLWEVWWRRYSAVGKPFELATVVAGRGDAEALRDRLQATEPVFVKLKRAKGRH